MVSGQWSVVSCQLSLAVVGRPLFAEAPGPLSWARRADPRFAPDDKLPIRAAIAHARLCRGAVFGRFRSVRQPISFRQKVVPALFGGGEQLRILGRVARRCQHWVLLQGLV